MVNKIANIYNYIIELYKNELSYEAAKLETKRKLFVCLYKGCKFLCWGTVIFAIIFTLGYYLFLTGYQSEQQTPEHIIGAGIPIMVYLPVFAILLELLYKIYLLARPKRNSLAKYIKHLIAD